MLVSCTSTRPTVKIGLVAPFEGVQRSLGYEVLYAVKLAVQERSAQGDVGNYGVELVALSDDGQAATAGRRVQALAADPGVLGALGPWQTATAEAAAPAFAQAGLPAVIPAALADAVLHASPGVYRLYAGDSALARTLAPSVAATATWTLEGDASGWSAALERATANTGTGAPVVILTGDGESIAHALTGGSCQIEGVTCLAGPAAQEPVVAARAGTALGDLTWVSSLPVVDCHNDLADFCTSYTALAGQPPGPHAVLAYDAANVLLDAIAQAASTGELSRQGVTTSLAHVQRSGLSGTVAFDADHSWAKAPSYLYRRAQDGLVR